MSPKSFSLFLIALVAGAAACAHEPADEATSTGEGSLVTCGASLPGPPLLAGAVEGDPSFASVFAATDTSSVADPFDLRASSLIARSMASYMLGQRGAQSFTRGDALARGGLGKSVLAAAARGQDGALDSTFLRQGLHHHYLCENAIPESLDALVQKHGDYKSWSSFEIPCSKAKNGPRRIYEDEDAGVFVAETLVGGAVRETEVIFSKLRTDGQLDFAAYTETGALTNRSTFATGNGGSVTLAAPFTCMTCHVDRATGNFDRRFPTGTGAGCGGGG